MKTKMEGRPYLPIAWTADRVHNLPVALLYQQGFEITIVIARLVGDEYNHNIMFCMCIETPSVFAKWAGDNSEHATRGAALQVCSNDLVRILWKTRLWFDSRSSVETTLSLQLDRSGQLTPRTIWVQGKTHLESTRSWNIVEG